MSSLVSKDKLNVKGTEFFKLGFPMGLHPFMHEYVSTDASLIDLINKHFTSDQFLEIVFKDLLQTNKTIGVEKKLLLDIDLAIINGHPDTNIYMLFIVNAVFYTIPFQNKIQTNSLNSITSSVSPEKIHPVINSLCMQATALIKKSEGNLVAFRGLMRQSIAILDKKQPRYNAIFLNYIRSIADEGLINEISQIDLESIIPSLNSKHLYFYYELRIVNSVMSGNYKEGLQYLEECKKNEAWKNKANIEIAISFLNIISGDLNELNYQKESHKIIVRVYYNLMISNREEVFKSYKLLENNAEVGFAVLKLVDYLSIHTELFLGNKGMAKLLLKEKEDNGNAHFMDNLFYGRIYLLDKKWEAADSCFYQLLADVKKYGFENRLLFELQFVKEMKFSDMVLLTNGWKKDVPYEKSEKEKIKSDPVKINGKGIHLLIGNSSKIKQIKEIVKKYATLKAPVLITGETGTGKELVSRAIHDEGLHPKEPFLAINSGALTDSLLQSELFGYEAGAFTGAQKQRKGIFEAAGKGTVFLDEFGDISPKLQVSLLRVLEANEIRMIGSNETRKIECKIVVATNIDLHQAVVDKKFREDLFFRLTRFEIKIPSLKDRSEDIPELINYFLNINAILSGASKKVSPELLNALMTYHWPGNIRELKNEIDRLYILNSDHELLGLEHFDFGHLQAAIVQTSEPQSPPTTNIQTNHRVKEESVLKVIEKGFPMEKRLSLIKDLFREYNKLTRSQVMEIAKVSPKTATKDLQKLIELGFIVRRTPTKSQRTDYFEIVV